VRRASSRERCTSERTTRGDATRPVVYRAPGALKAPLEGDELVDRSAGPGPIGRWPNCTSRLDGLGVSFRAGPHSQPSLRPSFRPLPFALAPHRRLPLAFSLPRARGPWEWPWKFNSPPSNGVLPRPRCALSLFLSLPLPLPLPLSGSPHLFPLPRRPPPPPHPYVPSSLCVACWNLTSLRPTVAPMHRVVAPACQTRQQSKIANMKKKNPFKRDMKSVKETTLRVFSYASVWTGRSRDESFRFSNFYFECWILNTRICANFIHFINVILQVWNAWNVNVTLRRIYIHGIIYICIHESFNILINLSQFGKRVQRWFAAIDSAFRIIFQKLEYTFCSRISIDNDRMRDEA